MEEALALGVAAARDNLAVGAWIGEAAVRSARAGALPTANLGQAMQALMTMRAEVMENRRLLRNVAGNLNDVARHANTTGHVPLAAARVLARVHEATEQLDELVRDLDTATRLARDELSAARRRT